MDLQGAKVTPEQKVSLCKTYFYLGFLFLPFIWGVNAVWFFGEGFRKPAFEGQGTIRRLVVGSAIGATLWAVGLLAWIVTFTVNRCGLLAIHSLIIPSHQVLLGRHCRLHELQHPHWPALGMGLGPCGLGLGPCGLGRGPLAWG